MIETDSPSDSAVDTASQLQHSAFRLFRTLRSCRTERGGSLARFSVLGRLYQGGIATATALATYLNIQPQSVTRLLAELERNGWIVRRSNTADRRQSLIEITETGTQLLLEEINAQQAMLAQRITALFTPAEQAMLRLAAGLMDRLAAESEVQAHPAVPHKTQAPKGRHRRRS